MQSGKYLYFKTASTSLHFCGVENRRSGGSLPVALGAVFTAPPQSGLAWLCFLFPLIEPDVRICRIRLSEKTHAIAEAIACDAAYDS